MKTRRIKTKRVPPYTDAQVRLLEKIGPEIGSDLHAAWALLQTEEGRRRISAAFDTWHNFRRIYRTMMADLPDEILVTIVLASAINEEVQAAVRAVFASDAVEDAYWNGGPEIRVFVEMACFARAAQRPDFQIERFEQEVCLTSLREFAQRELIRRFQQHWPGAALLISALAYQWPPTSRALHEGWLNTLAERWVSLGAKLGWRGRITQLPMEPHWAQEKWSVVAARLARELKRLHRSKPLGRLVLDAIQGKLNYHKTAAKQAEIDESRRPSRKERHVFIDPTPGKEVEFEALPEHDRRRPRIDEDTVHRVGPTRPPKIRRGPPSDIVKIEQTIDAEIIAASVAQALRLPAAEARVVRIITIGPERSLKKTAEIARVSLSTVEATLRRLRDDIEKIAPILLPR